MCAPTQERKRERERERGGRDFVLICKTHSLDNASERRESNSRCDDDEGSDGAFGGASGVVGIRFRNGGTLSCPVWR